MKCEICKGKVHTTFLNKLVGTYVKNSKGKKIAVCFECQKKLNSKEDMLKAIE